MAYRPEGFRAPPQNNPAGYQGTGRGTTPYSPQPMQPIRFPGAYETDRNTAPNNEAPRPHPIFASTWHELGVGISNIRDLGILGVRL